MVGLVNSHDNKGVLAYSFGLLSQPTSDNVLAIALKDTGMFRGRRILDIDGRNTCEKLCESLGWSYATLSEPNPIFLANLNWLAGYRRTPENFNQFATAIIEKAVKRQTVKNLLADIGPQTLVRPVLFFLMWKQQLNFDTRLLLSNTSEVWLAE